MGAFESAEAKALNIYSDGMPDTIREYLRDDFVSDEDIERYWVSAVKYVEQYTGLEREELEKYGECVQAVLAICGDMHDNRFYQGERTYLNNLVDSILGLHRANLL
jgi:hypothetical protein